MNEFGSERRDSGHGDADRGSGRVRTPSQGRTRGSDSGYRSASYNEYSYEPPKKNNNSSKGLNIALVVLCLFAIGISSVVGISLIRDATSNVGENSSASGTEPVKTAPPVESAPETVSGMTESTAAEEVPIITQQPASTDTLSIPEIVTKVSPSVVGISCITASGSASGTGIIMSEDGYIITNAHVVEDATAVSVVITDSTAESEEADDSSKSVAEKILEKQNTESSSEKNIAAELVGIDQQTDLAVLKITKAGLVEAEFGSSGSIKVGELAVVIGNPLGFDLANTVTSGIISATNRTLTIKDRSMNYIQTDASINSGNSGGPLINAYGQVIGITSAKVSSSYGEGLGFAIPIDEAQHIIYDLIQYGYVKGRPTLGISGQNINSFYADYYDIPQGFIVRSVESGSAAEKAGIRVNDIIVGIQGEMITTFEQFNKIKEEYKAGDTITVSVYRDREDIRDVEVTLDELKSNVDGDQSAETRRNNYYYNGYDDFFDNFPW